VKHILFILIFAVSASSFALVESTKANLSLKSGDILTTLEHTVGREDTSTPREADQVYRQTFTSGLRPGPGGGAGPAALVNMLFTLAANPDEVFKVVTAGITGTVTTTRFAGFYPPDIVYAGNATCTFSTHTHKAGVIGSQEPVDATAVGYYWTTVAGASCPTSITDSSFTGGATWTNVTDNNSHTWTTGGICFAWATTIPTAMSTPLAYEIIYTWEEDAGPHIHKCLYSQTA
jgi:hypothetical protein